MKILRGVSKSGPVAAIAAVIAVIAFTHPDFLSGAELQILMLTAAPLGVLAIGATFIMVAGEFDLSFAASVSLGLTVAGRLGRGSLPVLAVAEVIVVTVMICVLVGALNAFFVVVRRAPSFFATLAVGGLIGGITASGIPVRLVGSLLPGPAGPGGLSAGSWAVSDAVGVPAGFGVFCIVALAAWFALERSPWGRDLHAVGYAIEVASIRGVRVTRVQGLAFVVMGLACGIAALMLAPTWGSSSNVLFDALTCVYIGTSVLRPGQFHVVGTVTGVVLVTVLVTGLAFIVVPYEYQALLVGALLIGAVCGTRRLRRI